MPGLDATTTDSPFSYKENRSLTLPAYFTGDDDDMTDADSPTSRIVHLARSDAWRNS